MHHITHIKNLKSILEDGYLYSRNILKKKSKTFEDTANISIIEARKKVKFNERDIDLNDYIPFHIDLIQTKWGIGYNYEVCNNYGIENLIFILLKEEKINAKYSLYHPASSYGKIFDDVFNFKEEYKKELHNLPKLKDKKLDFGCHKVQQFFKSEILLKDRVKVSEIEKIYVCSLNQKRKVDIILEEYACDIPVEINWEFYKVKE